MKTLKSLGIFRHVLLFVGALLITWFDWRVGVGLVCLFWAMDIQKTVIAEDTIDFLKTLKSELKKEAPDEV